MVEFFEKLRFDRLNADAREMIGEIENTERRDQLRVQLFLKYSGVDRLLTGEGSWRKRLHGLSSRTTCHVGSPSASIASIGAHTPSGKARRLPVT